MKPMGNRERLLLMFVLILIFLALATFLPDLLQAVIKGNNPEALLTGSPSPSVTGQMPGTPVGAQAPGLVVSGKVTDLNGVGVENVKIYRSYASYPGEVIATTDANGYYVSAFYAIPGDENITIWAEKAGTSFDPENYNWRHYYGFEHAECNFQISSP